MGHSALNSVAANNRRPQLEDKRLPRPGTSAHPGVTDSDRANGWTSSPHFLAAGGMPGHDLPTGCGLIQTLVVRKRPGLCVCASSL